LKPFLAGHELFEFESVQQGSTLPLPGFTFDFGNVASRASLLFPFVTPGLSLDAFGQISDRPSNPRLFNPLTTLPATDSEPVTALSLTEPQLQAILATSGVVNASVSIEPISELAKPHVERRRHRQVVVAGATFPDQVRSVRTLSKKRSMRVLQRNADRATDVFERGSSVLSILFVASGLAGRHHRHR
jgi:hypothetical protein